MPGLHWMEGIWARPGTRGAGARVAPGMEPTCPRPHGNMRTCERNGVHVDQGPDCRGIFLDRGELDRLIDAENAWHGGSVGAPAAQSPHRQLDDERSGHRQAASGAGPGGVVGEVLRQVQGSKHSMSSHGRRKKEAFLGDLSG